MGTPSMGHQAQMAFDSVLPFDGSSIPLEFRDESMGKQSEILDTAGVRGTRSHVRERTRTGTNTAGGVVNFHMSPIMLDHLLPVILGAAEAADVFDIAETLPQFQIMVDRVAKVFTYNNCRVNRATFRGTQGQICELALDIQAESETEGAAGTFPALTMPTDEPYVFSDGVLTLLSTAREFESFEIVVDNVLDVDRHMNNTGRSELPSTDRVVTCRFTFPFTPDETDLHDMALAGAASATFVLTNADTGGNTCTFDFATIQFPKTSPSVPGRDEVKLTLQGTARKVGSTSEIKVTNVHT